MSLVIFMSSIVYTSDLNNLACFSLMGGFDPKQWNNFFVKRCIVVHVAYIIWSGLKLTQYHAATDYRADLEPKDSLKGCSCEWFDIDLKTWQKKMVAKTKTRGKNRKKQTNEGNINYVS